jgi:hypothetical protein
MSNEQKIPKSAYATPKLSDTQLVLLSAAAQREDHCLTPTSNLRGGAAHKVAEKLIAAGMVREIKAKTGTPVWRRDDAAALSLALKLTAAGLKAIAVDDEAEDGGSGAIRQGVEIRRSSAPPRDFSGHVQTRPSEASGGEAHQICEGGAPSIPRPGSKTAEIIDLLQREQGATIDELIATTGWLPHTTRAALTGLKKRGYEIVRSRPDGVTRYRIGPTDLALNGSHSEAHEECASATLCEEQAA